MCLTEQTKERVALYQFGITQHQYLQIIQHLISEVQQREYLLQQQQTEQMYI